MFSSDKKLEDCEVCGKSKAKYTCPKCEVRSCCLTCSNIHKKELECDGIRDKTKYLPIKSMTDSDLMSDYCLLQEVGRSVDKYNRDPLKRCTTLNNFLPTYLRKLKGAAFRRGINLEFMPRSFSRSKQNTTRIIYKTNELFWRIDWIFPQAENIKWTTEKASENARLSVLLENVLEPGMKAEENPEVSSLKSILRGKLQFYRSAGLNGMKVLMKAEKVEKSNCRFYELDPALTLTENLEQRTIIEYPTLYVILSHNADMYDIIDSDDEAGEGVEQQQNPQYRHKLNKNHNNPKQNENGTQNVNEEGKTGTINFLFHTEFSESEDEKLKVEKEKNPKNRKLNQRKRKHSKNQKEHIPKKIERRSDCVNEFTGICKSDSEDEMISKRDSQETVTALVLGNAGEVQKSITKCSIDLHITDSEGEGPDETPIQRFEEDEDQKNKTENSSQRESTDKSENSRQNETSNSAVQSLAMNYFSAYMSDSEDETLSENMSSDRNSGLQIPDYNDLVQMKH